MAREAKHRDKIVRATAELLRRRGFAATGINEITELSGAPKGSLYHYFPGGKEEIAAEAVRYAGERVRATITELVATHKSPAETVRAYGILLGGWLAQSGFVDGCPISTALLEAGPNERAIVDAGRTAFAAWVEAFALGLVGAGASPDAAERAARAAVMLLEGALIFARVERSDAAIVTAVEEAARLFDAAIARSDRAQQ
jgi:TetR/AcrR family transcriptional regulator, lmrAB and yxaGH operons repressor